MEGVGVLITSSGNVIPRATWGWVGEWVCDGKGMGVLIGIDIVNRLNTNTRGDASPRAIWGCVSSHGRCGGRGGGPYRSAALAATSQGAHVHARARACAHFSRDAPPGCCAGTAASRRSRRRTPLCHRAACCAPGRRRCKAPPASTAQQGRDAGGARAVWRQPRAAARRAPLGASPPGTRPQLLPCTAAITPGPRVAQRPGEDDTQLVCSCCTPRASTPRVILHSDLNTSSPHSHHTPDLHTQTPPPTHTQPHIGTHIYAYTIHSACTAHLDATGDAAHVLERQLARLGHHQHVRFAILVVRDVALEGKGVRFDEELHESMRNCT